MPNRKPVLKTQEQYRRWLAEAERSENTIQKYTHDATEFLAFITATNPNKTATNPNKTDGQSAPTLTHEIVLAYKKHLEAQYAPASVNSKIAAINSFLGFCGLVQYKLKSLKLQRRMFAPEEKELTQSEYKRLLSAAKAGRNRRLYHVMQTICATGIRVSELQYITTEAAQIGRAEVNCKGKRRVIFLTPELCKLLLKYAKRAGVKSGAIFLSRSGKPLSRHRIWADMKALCQSAGVDKCKVFPHNLRHLFARTFYSVEKDLGRLADVLGHSNINTTRIYTMDCGKEHMKILRRLPLLAK